MLGPVGDQVAIRRPDGQTVAQRIDLGAAVRSVRGDSPPMA